jgi:regulator of protease activity HflC (stomatin/prohibitin superfamily)
MKVPGRQPEWPYTQSARVASGVLRVAALGLAVAWAAGNIRSLPPASQAVILRWGAVQRTQSAGLVLAWPRPVEQVVILAGADRQRVLTIAAPSGQAGETAGARSDLPNNALAFLTGDGGVEFLDSMVTWRIQDARTYYVMRAHVEPALRRIFLAAAVATAAQHALDDFLAIRPDRAVDPRAYVASQALCGEIVAAMNASLAALAAGGAGLGVEVTGAGIAALLPPAAKPAFDAALEAAQHADQAITAARTDAAQQRQQADRERDRILSGAHAASAERVEQARTTTATLTALAAKSSQASRPAWLGDLYRDRIAGILRQAGSVNTVDAKSVSRLILPGGLP